MGDRVDRLSGKNIVMRLAISAAIALSLAAPLAARDSLGIFGDWGAFRDAEIPRCYAIAKPYETEAADDRAAFASIGTWPLRKIRGQVHFRLSAPAARGSAITLIMGSRRFSLIGRANNVWARDQAMDAAIVATIRSASIMTVAARDSSGKRIRDIYRLDGAASAMDAATVACARRR